MNGLLEICLTTARNVWAKHQHLSWDEMERIARKAARAGAKATRQRDIINQVCKSFDSQLLSKSRTGRGTERERLLYFVEHWPT